MPVRFHYQNIRFSLKKKGSAAKLIRLILRKEKKREGKIHFIFCSDRFLHALNKKYLKHDTLTDVIAFTYPAVNQKPKTRNRKPICGEVYISIPRVKENAKKFKVPFENELRRVMIHGILHLCGYRDKKPGERKEMRRKEEYYLGRGKS